MDTMTRTGRMRQMVVMVGMISVLASSVAVAQSVSLPQGSYSMQGSQMHMKDDLFNGTQVFEKGASDVTEITMDPDTLEMVRGKDGKRAHNMILNVVRTYTYDKPGMYRMEDVDAFRNKLNTGEWHCSVHTRELKRGESTDICNKLRSDDLSETAIITVEPRQLTFIHTIRKGGSGESYLGSLPMMLSAPGASLAMIDPDAYGEMQIAMARINTMGLGSLDSAALQLKIATAMKNAPKLDSAEMEKELDAAATKLDEQAKKLDERLKSDQPKLHSATPAPQE